MAKNLLEPGFDAASLMFDATMTIASLDQLTL
jgi:hypothetical protein